MGWGRRPLFEKRWDQKLFLKALRAISVLRTILIRILIKSFDQTFLKVWPPAGSPKANPAQRDYNKLITFVFIWLIMTRL